MSGRNQDAHPTEDPLQRNSTGDAYPTEDHPPPPPPGNQRDGNEYPGEDDEQPMDDDDDNTNSSAVTETPTEKYYRRMREANSVWFSGYFSGASYLPKPKRVDVSDLDESVQEELLEEKSYEVPRGYKYLEDNIPPIIAPKPTGCLQSSFIVHTIFSFMSFALLLCSACPIPWYKGKDVTIDGVNYKGVKYTLYHQKGGSLPEVSLRELRTCPIEKQFYQSIAASIIMAMMFSLISMILSIARLCGGKVGYGWIFVFGFFAFFWALCGNAMSISQFHLSRCGKPRYPAVATLDAGFALSLLAWIFQCIGVLVILFATRLNFGPALRNVRVMDAWFLVLILVALLFCVVGNATTIWKRRFNDDTVRVVRVTYWHTELIQADGTNIIYGRAHYRCSAYNKRIKASISFLILGSVTLFFAMLGGIAAFNKRGMRVLAVVMAIISWVFLTISWVTSVVIFSRTLCKRNTSQTLYADYPGVPSGVVSGHTKFTGYGLAEGVVLVIAAWALVTTAIIANFVVPWPQEKRF